MSSKKKGIKQARQETRRIRKLAKKRASRKDWEKKRNIMDREVREIRKGTRTGFSVEMPERKKI